MKSNLIRNQSFNDLIDRFLLQQQYQVKESTFAHYCNLAEKHIRPQLGAIPLRALTSETIEAYTSEKLRSGKCNRQGGLSAKSVRDLLVLIHSIIKYGVDKELLPGSALHFSIPRVKKQEIEVFSPQEQRILEINTKHTDNVQRFGIYFCLYTGLRIGELCALQWKDIDFQDSSLHVSKTMQRITDYAAGEKRTKLVIDAPKTESSRRMIPLPLDLNQLLRAHRACAASEEAYFLTGTGKYIEPRNYYGKYKNLLAMWQLPSYTFHALRHTFATRCIEKGFDPKALSEILGHSNVRITLDRYVHPSIEHKRNCMELLYTKC